MSGTARRARIAVINDDTAFLELMHDLLETEENYEVLLCTEWDHAYEVVKPFDLDTLLSTIDEVLADKPGSSG